MVKWYTILWHFLYKYDMQFTLKCIYRCILLDAKSQLYISSIPSTHVIFRSIDVQCSLCIRNAIYYLLLTVWCCRYCLSIVLIYDLLLSLSAQQKIFVVQDKQDNLLYNFVSIQCFAQNQWILAFSCTLRKLIAIHYDGA